MFWAVIAILLMLWVMGTFLSLASGGFTPVFIIIAVLLAVATFFAGRRLE
jgi:hypothetical protein